MEAACFWGRGRGGLSNRHRPLGQNESLHAGAVKPRFILQNYFPYLIFICLFVIYVLILKTRYIYLRIKLREVIKYFYVIKFLLENFIGKQDTIVLMKKIIWLK